MKQQIILLALLISLLPLTMVGQKNYYNLDFERSDTIGYNVIQVKSAFGGTVMAIDSARSVSGKYSLSINTVNTEIGTYGLITFILPKQWNKGLRTIDITVSIFAQNNTPNFQCIASKGKETIGCNMTCSDSSSWFTEKGKGVRPGRYRPGVCLITEVKPAPKTDVWTTHSFNITIDKDPTEVMFYLIIPAGITLFDNLSITLNGSPIKLVFEL